MSNAKWINIPANAAIRRTRTVDTLSCDVDGGSTEALDLAFVEFTVADSHGKSAIYTVTQRTMRTPDFSDYPSRLPGGGDKLSPSNCFGITVQCSEWAPGRISISAKANFGISEEVLPTIYLLNDKDGTDRRGTSKVVYLRGQTGNDAAAGGPSDPVKSLNRAIQLVHNGGNAGGGKIICDEEVVGCGPLFGSWHADDQWLTIEFLPGSFWRRGNAGQDTLVCNGFGGNYRCNLRFVNMEIRGVGMILSSTDFPTAQTTFRVWGENCTQRSPYYTPGVRWSVRHLEDFGKPFSFSGVASVGNGSRVYFTGFRSVSAAYGPASISGLYDFIIEDYIGIAMQPEGAQQEDLAINGVIRSQRSRSIDVKGYINARGGTAFSISQPNAGEMRITATGTVFFSDSFDNQTTTPVNIATQLQEIAGSNYWWVNLENFGTHTGRHQVLNTGTDSGNPYITIEYAGTVTPGTAPANARLRTIRDNGSPYDPHPDICQWLGERRKGFYKNIDVYDISDSQGWFTSGPVYDMVLVNVTDAATGGRNPIGGGGAGFVRCLIHNCTFLGSWDSSTGDALSNSNVMRDCVVRQMTGVPASFFSVLDRIHFTEGTPPPFATNATTGPFFVTGVNPLPSKFNLGQLQQCPDVWVWPGASSLLPDTQGVYANIGNHNWGVSNNPLTFSSTATSTSSMSMNVRQSLTLSSTAVSTSSLNLIVKRGLAMIGYAPSTSAMEILVGNPATLTLGSIAGSASSISNVVVTRTFTLQSSAPSTTGMSLAGEVTLTMSSISPSTTSMAIDIVRPPTILPVAAVGQESRTEMKQRIFNTLRALLLNGPYHACTINKKTGQMSIDVSKKIAPEGVVVKEIRSSYRNAQRYKRSFNVQELEIWQWIGVIDFTSTEVSCEAFEDTVTASGITIPPVLGLDTANNRTLLARLVGCEYTHPAEQSPNTGTRAEFTFEIEARLLRK